MTGWHDLVVAATVGTASRPVDLAATPPAVLTAAPPHADPAGSLLDAAVAFTVAQRAGRRPTQAEIPLPAPADPRPLVSPFLAGVLQQVLADGVVDLVALVLGQIGAAGRRMPDRLVPAALTLAVRHPALRAPTAAACGPVAQWLAEREPAWRRVVRGGVGPVLPFDAAAWETGTATERLALLRTLRASDPAAAAALLHTSWTSTAPDEREDLLRQLGPDPHPADEPLLEALLDDRRSSVRQLAGESLGRLEGSAFRARAARRVQGMLRVERRGLRRAVVVVDPEPFDAATRRDGLQERPAAPQALGPATTTGPGPVATRVRQLVAAAPLDVWEQETGVAPDRLVATTVERFPTEVVQGWIAATRREGDARWAEALLAADRHHEPIRLARAGLVAALPPERRLPVVVAALRAPDPAVAAAVLATVRAPWDGAVTAGFVGWWRAAVRLAPGRELLTVLPLAGRGLPATAEYADALRRGAEHAPDGAIWLRAAREAAEIIDLRRRLHEELA